ncbi:MAG TPA: MerR family DNA-binding transcriptional regulator [Azospirillaceae bacterium]|nr:MerR family DNA-binding transcriptional regulator [Azospirillaceae bacterium]
MPDAAQARTYTIGELSRELGLTARSIRFYEDEGLLSPGRDGQNRVYTHADRGRLLLICRGKRLGFSLREIKGFLDLYEADPEQREQMRFLKERCRERIEALEGQLRDVQLTLAELREVERQIDEHLSPRAARPRTVYPEDAA